MVSICLLLGLLMSPASAHALAPSFSGSLRLPVDLYAASGTRLEKGQYTIQVKQDNGKYSLSFIQNDKPKVTVEGEVLGENADALRPHCR